MAEHGGPPPGNAAAFADVMGCVGLNVRMTSRELWRIYDRAIAPSGLRSTQFTLMAAIGALGRITMTELANYLSLDRTTLTRNLRPLQRRGFVASGVGADRRRRELWLTPEGVTACEEALPLWRKAQEELLGEIGTARWQALQLQLDELRRVAREH